MKAAVIFTGSGPILILTTYPSVTDPKLIEKLTAKGIRKFLAFELPVERVKERYGLHFNIVMGDLSQSDDLRVLDYDGHRVFNNFSFKEMGLPVEFEG